MTKQQLINWAYDKHGIGVVLGYNASGFCGSWRLDTSYDVRRLPENIVYFWV